MLTLVPRRGHVNRQTSMATAEYRRGHGTHIFRFEKALGALRLCPRSNVLNDDSCYE